MKINSGYEVAIPAGIVCIAIIVWMSYRQDMRKHRELVAHQTEIAMIRGELNTSKRLQEIYKEDNRLLQKDRDSLAGELVKLEKENKRHEREYELARGMIKELPALASMELFLRNTGHEGFGVTQVGADSNFVIPVDAAVQSNVTVVDLQESKAKVRNLEAVVDVLKLDNKKLEGMVSNDEKIIEELQLNQGKWERIAEDYEAVIEGKDKELKREKVKLRVTQVVGGIGVVVAAALIIF